MRGWALQSQIPARDASVSFQNKQISRRGFWAIHLLLKPGITHLQNRIISSLTARLHSAGNICGVGSVLFHCNLDLNTYDWAHLWDTNCGQAGHLWGVNVCEGNLPSPWGCRRCKQHFLIERCRSFVFLGWESFLFFCLLSLDDFTHRGDVFCHARSSALAPPGTIILSVRFNVEQIRLRLTELVLHDGSLYPQRRQTAPASRGPSSLPALPVSNAHQTPTTPSPALTH